MGSLCTREGWLIREHVFWGLKAFNIAIYDSKSIFCQNKFLKIFEFFLSNLGMVMDEWRIKSTQQHQMGYRWNRLNPKNSKMLTEIFWTVSVLFQSYFSRFQPDQNLLHSPPTDLVQITSYTKRILSGHVTCAISCNILSYFGY